MFNSKEDPVLPGRLRFQFDEIGSQREKSDPLVLAVFRLDLPTKGAVRYYITEYDRQHDRLYGYGMTSPEHLEWISLSRGIMKNLMFGCEEPYLFREDHFNPQPISKLVPDFKPQQPPRSQEDRIEMER